MGLHAKEMQDLTYALCYTYQRSTTAVSYAPAAYYADRLADRGRQYLKDFLDPDDPETRNQLTESQIKVEVDNLWSRGGQKNGNPWHANLNDTMFWL